MCMSSITSPLCPFIPALHLAYPTSRKAPVAAVLSRIPCRPHRLLVHLLAELLAVPLVGPENLARRGQAASGGGQSVVVAIQQSLRVASAK
jgi:hypothetical protein